MNSKPIVWSIGGSDSGGGAGIQADIRTISAFGAHPCTVVTAVTAQNTFSVEQIEGLSANSIKAQMRALNKDLPALAVKIGMLYGREQIEAVVSQLDGFSGILIVDPVLVATSGDSLHEGDAVNFIRSELISRCSLLTPNLMEAHALLGLDYEVSLAELNDTLGEPEEFDLHIQLLSERLIEAGARAVLIKGGHRQGGYSQDFFNDGSRQFWLTSKRLQSGQFHGTGCTLSAAIAAAVAAGYSMTDAIVMGKTYINQCLRVSKQIGKGATLLGHDSFHPLEEDLPILTARAREARSDIKVSALEERIGFYPIVDRAKWIDELAPAGVKTMQIRIKDLTGAALLEELKSAVSSARRNKICLYVNDYWQQAIEIGAFGVHLGQEDLQKADLDALCQSGLRIGISTHCWSEVARALSIKPSYIAVGPIFPTTAKKMPFAPQGLSGFSLWRRLLSSPLVAIGGISLESGRLLAELGADGIAVISDICNAGSPVQRASQWVQMIKMDIAPDPLKSEYFCKSCQTFC